MTGQDCSSTLLESMTGHWVPAWHTKQWTPGCSERTVWFWITLPSKTQQHCHGKTVHGFSKYVHQMSVSSSVTISFGFYFVWTSTALLFVSEILFLHWTVLLSWWRTSMASRICTWPREYHCSEYNISHYPTTCRPFGCAKMRQWHTGSCTFIWWSI